jgi:hypothetical protein
MEAAPRLRAVAGDQLALDRPQDQPVGVAAPQIQPLDPGGDDLHLGGPHRFRLRHPVILVMSDHERDATVDRLSQFPLACHPDASVRPADRTLPSSRPPRTDTRPTRR